MFLIIKYILVIKDVENCFLLCRKFWIREILILFYFEKFIILLFIRVSI